MQRHKIDKNLLIKNVQEFFFDICSMWIINIMHIIHEARLICSRILDEKKERILTISEKRTSWFCSGVPGGGGSEHADYWLMEGRRYSPGDPPVGAQGAQSCEGRQSRDYICMHNAHRATTVSTLQIARATREESSSTCGRRSSPLWTNYIIIRHRTPFAIWCSFHSRETSSRSSIINYNQAFQT